MCTCLRNITSTLALNFHSFRIKAHSLWPDVHNHPTLIIHLVLYIWRIFLCVCVLLLLFVFLCFKCFQHSVSPIQILCVWPWLSGIPTLLCVCPRSGHAVRRAWWGTNYAHGRGRRTLRPRGILQNMGQEGLQGIALNKLWAAVTTLNVSFVFVYHCFWQKNELHWRMWYICSYLQQLCVRNNPKCMTFCTSSIDYFYGAINDCLFEEKNNNNNFQYTFL